MLILLLGFSFTGRGMSPGAQAAYQIVIDSGDAETAAKAAHNLGDLLADQEDVEGAKAAYQIAIDSGNSEVVPMTVLRLGSSSRAPRR